MATISFSATSLTAKSFTLSPADVARVLAALRANYGTVSDGAGGQRAMTDQEVFDKWATGNMLALRDVVKRVEGDSAADTAREGVTDISYS